MSIIEASSGTYSSRVDGTIVLRVEIEPRHRAEALALFGMPGTPMALAALKSQSMAEPEEKEERPFRGELCRWAAIRCTEPSFIAWIESAHHEMWRNRYELGDDAEEAAAEVLRSLCGVASRVELDTNDEAGRRFHFLIRQPYAKWLKENPK